MNSNNGVPSQEAEAIDTTSASIPDATAIVDIDSVATVPPQNTTIGPYVLERELGQGAMGAVYLATHNKLKRKVALKVLPASLIAVPGRLSRFRHEMEAVGRLDHPNIVRATDAGDVDGVHYLAMEFVNGFDLAQVLERSGAMHCAAACEVARQTGLGLQHIYENHLVHRDIKPSNLMLDAHGQVKILDLGIAMLRQQESTGDLTAPNAVMGTPDYMAPEQVLETRDVDIRADIYSLGCTLYSLLTGRPPFDGPGYESQVEKLVAHGTQAPNPLQSLAPDTPKALAKVVERMMSKDPEDRYQTPQHAVDALSPWADASALLLLTRELGVHMCEGRAPADTVGRKQERTVRERLAKTQPRQIRRKLHLVAVSSVALVILAAAAILLLGTTTSRKQTAAKRTADDARPDFVPPVNEHEAPALEGDDPTASAVDDRAADAWSDVPRDTRAIRLSSERLADTTDQINKSTRQIAETLDAMRQTFQSAAESGDLVDHPDSPSEFYHNARIHEMRGDYASARESYLRFLELAPAFVDVHHRFQKFLKLQEGLAGAREMYGQLSLRMDNPVGQYAIALLQEPEQRQIQLTALANREPDFAPAFYELSRYVSQANLGRQTLDDKRREKELLERFLALHRRGQLVKYFLDQSEAASMVEDANRRMASLGVFEAEFFDHPVRLLCSKHRNGWNVAFRVAEPTREIFYRLESSDEFQSTGLTDQLDPRTGAQRSNTSIALPIDVGSCDIEVKYTDLRGSQRGPYTIAFDPAAETVRHAKRTLELTKNSWLSFGRRQNARNLYFTHLAIYKDAIAEVHFALDQDQPTTQFELPDLSGGNSPKLWVKVPPETQYAVVQVTFRDGTNSELVRFERPQR